MSCAGPTSRTPTVVILVDQWDPVLHESAEDADERRVGGLVGEVLQLRSRCPITYALWLTTPRGSVFQSERQSHDYKHLIDVEIYDKNSRLSAR